MHRDKRRTGNGQGKQRDYIRTQGEQVKVIRVGEDNQGGGRTHKDRERGSETRGKVNTSK